MSIYVGKKSQRGVVGSKDPIIQNVKNINATSGSMNKVNGISIKDVSPMYLGPVCENTIFGTGNNIAQVFENYWQYSKLFSELGHIDNVGNPTSKWYEFRNKGFRKNKGNRHPIGTKSNDVKFVDAKGKNHYRYYSACYSIYFDQKLDYLQSRKLIYVPVYAFLVVKTLAYQELVKLVTAGESVQILDNDVLPGSHLVTLELLKERINDPVNPFGHGYVLAGLLSGITPDKYCQL